jgi:DNA-binding MarR family transcriptional regulator
VPSRATRDNLGYLLAKASQRWNELLYEGFVREGYPEVRPSYGSVLIPLFEEDGLRMGEIAERARLSKQTITTMVRLCERDGLVTRRPDPDDGRASRVALSRKARAFQPAAERVLAELEAAVRDLLGERRVASLRDSARQVADLASAAERSGDGIEPSKRGAATPCRL